MERISRIAVRYGASLFDAAASKKKLDKVAGDLSALKAILSSSPQVKLALANPTIPRPQIQNVLREIAKQMKFQDVTNSFLTLLVEKQRAMLLEQIITHFERLLREKNNQLEVTVTSRHKLSKEHLAKLEKTLSQQTGKQILLNTTQDEEILGGIIVNYGSYKLDFSMKRKLNDLKQELERLS